MPIVNRAQWGARPAKYRYTRDMNAKSTGHWNGLTVVIAGKTSWDHSRCASLVRGIQNFHMDGRGWADIAYNFVVCPHGYVFEGRGLNVINGANGTNSGNRTSHAIMWLSGQGNPFTKEERIGWRDAYNHIRSSVGVLAGALGHRDHKSTECPGNERYNWLKAGMPVSGSIKPTTPKPSKPTNTPPTLRKGSSGKEALWLQETIRTKAGGAITVDGKFGDNTERRVRDLQRMFHISDDGIVGPETWKIIEFLNTL